MRVLPACPAIPPFEPCSPGLEKKGYLKHQQDRLRYIYSATTSPTVAKRNALQH